MGGDGVLREGEHVGEDDAGGDGEGGRQGCLRKRRRKMTSQG